LLYIETDSRDAAFHFSIEEYFLQRSDESVIMLWQTERCVMLGNYQTAEAEINVEYAQKEGMQIVRRSSGGGTIFTDAGTLLYTMILPCPKGSNQQRIAKDMLAETLVAALNGMGVPAKSEGRNDVTVDGKKVSGMAQYVRNDRVCSHCSLLYDTDLETLSHVLKVDEEKIRSKAIRSVRSRVTNIKDYMQNPLTVQDFRNDLRQKLLEGKNAPDYVLSSHERAKINSIYNDRYANPSWTFGKSPGFSYNNSKRFSGGRVDVFMDIVKGVIVSCSIRGDFLGTVPIRDLEEMLEEKEYCYKALDDALKEIALYPYLGDITKEQLLSCMFVR